MLPKRPNTEIENTIIKQGCLIKSPPVYLFSKRASWKARLFKLCKSPMDSYYLRYFAYNGMSEELKGNIAVSDIKSIQLGSNTMDKIVTITRLFNNRPENVLCIKTSKRDYYLVDDNVNNIADWHKSITDVWVKINQAKNVDGPQIAHPALVIPPLELTPFRLPRELKSLTVHPIQCRQKAVQPVRSRLYEKQAVMMDETVRPKSYPEEHPCTDPALMDAQERQRSLTDPAARKATLCVPGPITPVEMLELSKATLERKRSQTHSDSSQSVYPLKNEFRRLSLTEQKTDSRSLSEDTAYDSDSESIYDIPRPVPRKLSVQFSEDDDDCDVDSPDEHVYQPMRSLQNSFDSEKSSMEPAGLSQNPLDEQESMDHSSAQDQNDSSPPLPPRNFRMTGLQRLHTSKGSHLKKAYILKMMYEQDSSDYVKKNLTVPTAHLKKHLDLQEVGERLCVSKWKGPVDIGCVFHHGDHIIDINGFQPANKEFFFQMLDRFTKEEVDLVVIRNKKAGVFHAEGCNCRASWEERHLEEERNT